MPAGWVDRHRVFWRTQAGVFAVSLPIDGQPATVGNGSTVGFACQSAEQADAWHAAGLAHGGTTCEDPPGLREGAGEEIAECLRSAGEAFEFGIFRAFLFKFGAFFRREFPQRAGRGGGAGIGGFGGG